MAAGDVEAHAEAQGAMAMDEGARLKSAPGKEGRQIAWRRTRRLLCGLGILAVLAGGLNTGGVSAASPPPAPTNLAATVDPSGVHLTWGASAGASTYAVYRNGTQISPSSQTATALTDTA